MALISHSPSEHNYSTSWPFPSGNWDWEGVRVWDNSQEKKKKKALWRGCHPIINELLGSLCKCQQAKWIPCCSLSWGLPSTPSPHKSDRHQGGPDTHQAWDTESGTLVDNGIPSDVPQMGQWRSQPHFRQWYLWFWNDLCFLFFFFKGWGINNLLESHS